MKSILMIMELYLMQRLTYVHYVLLAIAIIVGWVTIVYTMNYASSWICEEPTLGNEKKFVRRASLIFACLLLLFIFVPTTGEYLALRDGNKKCGNKTEYVNQSNKISKSKRRAERSLADKDTIIQYAKFKATPMIK